MADDIPLEAVIRMGVKDTVPDKEPTVCLDRGIDARRLDVGSRIIRKAFDVQVELRDTTLDPADAMPR